MTRQPESESEAFREFSSYLRVLARVQLDPRLQGKIDLSGIIQQTLLEAHRAWEQLRGWTREQKAGWLRRALANNLADEIRKLKSQGRNAHREVSLDQVLEQSSARLEAWLVAEESTPAELAERQEEALRLAEALERLPEAEREAIVLQRWHGWTLAQIAQHLGRTPGAVAGLLHRGLDRLRKDLQGQERANG
jgi:RNA polymerase sigma-70 factor (ECF subfamily)